MDLCDSSEECIKKRGYIPQTDFSNGGKEEDDNLQVVNPLVDEMLGLSNLNPP